MVSRQTCYRGFWHLQAQEEPHGSLSLHTYVQVVLSVVQVHLTRFHMMDSDNEFLVPCLLV